MRIRCKPWAKPELEACPFYLPDPTACKGQWEACFPKKQPLRLELGCGKGGFISQEALANQNYNYVAIDIKNEMLVLAKRKLEQAYAAQSLPLDNVRICISNIMYLCNSFSQTDRVDRIYINFCNPWSHNKHKKRRLTHTRQLIQYRQILDVDLWFKTDDPGLFEESLAYFSEAGFRIRTLTRDLHREPSLRYFETEHEMMFNQMGKPIQFLIAEPDPDAPADHLQELLQTCERNAAHEAFNQKS
ncbi:MAG: tRNA (guanosine(46)-N7)-methyltransferase TrmB [Ruminococcus sp.]|nr:tRNA (guanosine(46)-N7)-methyltransferase TrmB [Ruminococcus sp.]